MHLESKHPSLYTELFHRHADNPILTSSDWPYPAHTVFNAGACQAGDETILLVRVEDRRGLSHLTVARSNDGVSNWQIDAKPSFAPDPENYEEEAWGVEDPRLTWVEDLGHGLSPTRPSRRAVLWFPWPNHGLPVVYAAGTDDAAGRQGRSHLSTQVWESVCHDSSAGVRGEFRSTHLAVVLPRLGSLG